MTLIKMELQDNAQYIESLLRQYGFRNVRTSHNGFTASCPFHEDRHPSFSISKKGLWMCWSCKAKGSLKSLHKAMGGGEQDWRDSLKAMGAQLNANKFYAKTKRKPSTIAMPEGFSAYASPEDVPPSISKRLQWDTIKYFGLGSVKTPATKSDWQLSDRCIIPIRYRGSSIGYHCRALKDDATLRYYNPAGFDIKEYVFNYDSCDFEGEVIIVEGAFNAMSMWEKGMKNCMAVFGTQFTSGQLQKILSLNPSSIVICFDRDPSKIVNGEERGKQGQKAAHKFGKLVHNTTPTFVMPLPVGMDPNDLSAAMLHKCYENRVAYERLFGVE